MRRALRLLHLRRLASIRARTVIAVIAVAAGSSLALSVVIAETSTASSVSDFSQQVGGSAALRVVGATTSGGLDAVAGRAVERTPGVGIVVPLVQAITAVRTSPGNHQTAVLLGIPCDAAEFELKVSCRTAGSSDGVFIAQSLERQLQPDAWFQTDRGARPLRHAVVLPSLDRINHGDVVVMLLPAAQRAFDRGNHYDDIYVTPARGIASVILQRRLEHAVGPWDGVVGATTPPPELSETLAAFAPLLSLLALLATGIAVVLVFNVISLTLFERRRERAIVASIGAPPSLLILGPLLESAVLGAVGGVLGAFGGIVLARPIVGTLSHLTVKLTGIPIVLHASASTYLIGLVVGIGIGLVAAIRPVVQAMREDIVAEISGREQRKQRSTRVRTARAVIYTTLAGAGAFVSWLGVRNGALEAWQPLAALGGFALAWGFSIPAMGAWTPVILKVAAQRGPRRHGVTRLGLANLVRDPGRTGVMAIAISATVGVAFITGSYNRAVDEDIAMQISQTPQAHSVLVSTVAGEGGNNPDARIPSGTITQLSRIRGVTSVDKIYRTLTGHEVGHLTVVESTSDPSFALGLYAGTANLAAFDRGEVIIGANLARRDDLRPGDQLKLDTATGIARVPIQGIWDNGDAAGDNVYLSARTFQHLFGTQAPLAAELDLAPGVSATRVAVRAKALHLGRDLTFATPSKQQSNDDAGIGTQLAPFLVLQRALLLVSFISVLSTLMLAALQRRRESAMLAAVGMKPRELFRMVVTEAFSVSVVAVVLGGLLGFLMLFSLLDVVPLLVGYHDSYSPDIGSLLLYGPIAVVVAVVASLWPAWQVSRMPILEALQYE